MNLENNYASFWIKGGILFFVYKEQIDIHLSDAMAILTDRLKLQREKAYPVLCDIRGVRSIDMDARRYLAAEGSVFIKAIALVSDTPLSLIFSKIYVTGNTPPIPTEVHTTYDDAIRFLSGFTS